MNEGRQEGSKKVRKKGRKNGRTEGRQACRKEGAGTECVAMFREYSPKEGHLLVSKQSI